MGFYLPLAYAQNAKAEPVAEVNGEAITAKDLESAIGAKLAKLQEQIYNLKRQELDNLIAQKLLAQEAAKRGISVPALLDAEVTSKVGLVTEKEIQDFYEQHKGQLRGNKDDLRPKIRAFMQQRKLAEQRAHFVESLRSQGKVLVNLRPPPIVRVDVSIKDAPFRGPANAPVTIVEFSDFECPFCKRVHPTLTQLLAKYPGKVKLVYRDFPLENIHPQARRAAEAARCAEDQGKFWGYYDALFKGSPKLSPDDLKRYATQVGLDSKKFDACVAKDGHKAAIQRDLEEGRRLGITGTPAFYINGRPLTGAQPLAAFTRVIDDELARAAGTAKK